MTITHIRPLGIEDDFARFRAFIPDFAQGVFVPAFDVLVSIDEMQLTERKGLNCGRVMIHPAEGANIDLSKAISTTGLIPVNSDGHVSKGAISRYLTAQRALNYFASMKQLTEGNTDGEDDDINEE